MGDALAFAGLFLGVIGLITLIKPIPRIGITSRMRGVAVFVAGLFLLAVGASMAVPSEFRPSTTSSVTSSGNASEEKQAEKAPPLEAGLGNGSHLVGNDIQPGTYRSTGRGTCYWARLRGFGGALDSIIANGNNAPEVVTIQSGDAGFETRGCGRWVPLGEATPATPTTRFNDGTYAVGVHIAPGRYRSNGSGTCYWARLSDFSHELGGIISNGNEATIVDIAQDDAGFTTFGCGSWNRLQQ